MRTIPVDLTRCTLIGTGKISPKAEYVELSNGERRASGNQAKDPTTGLPLWVVDVLVDDDDARRAEVIGVTVASAVEPYAAKYQAVNFRNVTARIYVDRQTGRASVSLVAESIDTVSGKSSSSSSAA